MAVVRVNITSEGHIPLEPEVLASVYMRAGDEVEIEPVTRGVLLIRAKSLAQEEARLAQIRQKMARIQDDLAAAEGLTLDEILLAAQYNLIDPEQGYWWSEEWQAGEREVVQEKETEQMAAFGSVDALLADLHSQ